LAIIPYYDWEEKMRKDMLWTLIPIVFSFIVGVVTLILNFFNQAQVDAFIASVGLTEPVALKLLAPTLEFLGAITLIAIRPQLKEEEGAYIRRKVDAHIDSNPPRLVPDVTKRHLKVVENTTWTNGVSSAVQKQLSGIFTFLSGFIDDGEEELMEREKRLENEKRRATATSSLERIERAFSVGFLTAGFLTQLLSVLLPLELPIIYYGWLMLAVAALWIGICYLSPRLRNWAVNGSVKDI
jgi:hypothetical protein